MEKKPFLTEAMAQQIIEDVPTPFHVYIKTAAIVGNG